MLLVRGAVFLSCVACLTAQTDTGQYSGPAILSRGETPGAQSAAPIAFRPYFGVEGDYTDGLVPVSVNSSGRIPVIDLYGVMADLGAYTHRTRKHTTLSLTYRGDFRHYSQNTYYDGTDQFLYLSLTHEVSRHVTLVLRTAAGTYSQSSFLLSTLNFLDDSNYLQLPRNDIFDNRSIFLSTAGDVTYHMTPRLSFNIGGEGDLERWRSTALYGYVGDCARADVQYRVGRRSIVGADYRFTNFSYTRGFGNTDTHSLGLDYATKLTRRLQLSMRMGAARVESVALAQVQLDPAVAALLGAPVGVQAVYGLHYVPDMSASLTERFRRSLLGVRYTDGVSPGNGVYITSRSQLAGVSYSYAGIHNWNFALNANYARMNTIVQTTLGAYTSYEGGVGVTREIGKGLHAVFRVDASHYDVAGNFFLHTEYRASVGLSFSPGDRPLVLW